MSTKKKTKAPIAAPPNVKLSEPMTQCLALLKAMMAKAEAAPFLEPVDWKSFGLVDYPTIIKTPMDLGTVLVRIIFTLFRFISNCFRISDYLIFVSRFTYTSFIYLTLF